MSDESSEDSAAIKIMCAKQALEIYRRFESEFGLLLLYYFTSSQLIWILSFYYSSAIFMSFTKFTFYNYSCFLNIVLALSTLLNSGKVCCMLDHLYDQLQKHKNELKNMPRLADQVKEREKEVVIEELKSTRYVSALGFFSINKRTIVKMMSFGFTQVVILLQFKVAEI